MGQYDGKPCVITQSLITRPGAAPLPGSPYKLHNDQELTNQVTNQVSLAITAHCPSG